MPRVMKPRPHSVVLTEHAWERFQERAGPYSRMPRRQLKRLLHSKLNNQLASGVYFDNTRAAKIEVLPWLTAVLEVTPSGWQVLTILYVDEEVAG
ncbi:MAG: hypothetical protein MJA84_00650 [Firmicutes bacterium]|nr:hypothetical protein [Bacillota bacterium]